MDKSTNGTWVNNKKIENSKEIEIVNNDEIGIVMKNSGKEIIIGFKIMFE